MIEAYEAEGVLNKMLIKLGFDIIILIQNWHGKFLRN